MIRLLSFNDAAKVIGLVVTQLHMLDSAGDGSTDLLITADDLQSIIATLQLVSGEIEAHHEERREDYLNRRDRDAFLMLNQAKLTFEETRERLLTTFSGGVS